MSSTPRSAGGKPNAGGESKPAASASEAAPARGPSPGRYSMADEGEDVPRIEATGGKVKRATMKMVGAPGPLPPRMTPSKPALPALNKTLVDADPELPFAKTQAQGQMASDLMDPAQRAQIAAATGTAQRKPMPSAIRSAAAALADSVPPPPTDERPPAPPTRRGSPPPLQLDPFDAAPPPEGKPPSAPPPAKRPSSLRPPPPSSKSKRPSRNPSLLPGALFEGFDEGSVLDAFDALMADGPTGPAGQETDLTPVRELFGELAASHMRHVRDFMIDVKWGEATRDWLEICVPAVTSLFRAAERLEIAELASALGGFQETLHRSITQGGARTIEGTTKDELLSSYEKLVVILPNAFALERDRNQRETVIVQSLLLSVPDVRKITIDKLHAAGVTSLATLYSAKPDEIAAVAGIPIELAMRIVERFKAYRHEIQNQSPSDARAAEREKLATLTGTLKKHHEVYEEASKGWDTGAKTRKRESFRAREEAWLEVSVLLARFGEVDRLAGIEKVPYGQRIAQLASFLEEAAENYRPF